MRESCQGSSGYASAKIEGVKIHVEDGESQSLQKLNDQQLHDFKEKAKNIIWMCISKTSASDKGDIDGCHPYCCCYWLQLPVRFYPCYEGHLNDVMAKIANDIAWLSQYDDCGLSFTIEQHEDLQGHELVTLVNNSGMKISLFCLILAT